MGSRPQLLVLVLNVTRCLAFNPFSPIDAAGSPENEFTFLICICTDMQTSLCNKKTNESNVEFLISKLENLLFAFVERSEHFRCIKSDSTEN
jgi:hypothetical protein